MFTGIVKDVGVVKQFEKLEDWRFVVKPQTFDLSDISIGDSVCCNGVCLTVVAKDTDTLSFDVSEETISCTVSGQWAQGARINLEGSLRVGDQIGGHFVTGHVDAVTNVLELYEENGSHRVVFAVPQALDAYVAAKGAVTLNGISLTVNTAERDRFSVNIIPHTWMHTNFSDLKVGTSVNMEIDVLARYVVRHEDIKKTKEAA